MKFKSAAAPAVVVLAGLSLASPCYADGPFAGPVGYDDPRIAPRVYFPLKPDESESAIALEQEYTLRYAHDPARPPMIIVNHPPAYEASPLVSVRY
jgi:hypothetical protein